MTVSGFVLMQVILSLAYSWSFEMDFLCFSVVSTSRLIESIFSMKLICFSGRVFLVMQVHIERVHLKVKQHCSFCEKKYSDVKNLLKHIEKRHNLKDPAVYQSYQQLRFDLQHLFLSFITV